MGNYHTTCVTTLTNPEGVLTSYPNGQYGHFAALQQHQYLPNQWTTFHNSCDNPCTQATSAFHSFQEASSGSTSPIRPMSMTANEGFTCMSTTGNNSSYGWQGFSGWGEVQQESSNHCQYLVENEPPNARGCTNEHLTYTEGSASHPGECEMYQILKSCKSSNSSAFSFASNAYSSLNGYSSHSFNDSSSGSSAAMSGSMGTSIEDDNITLASQSNTNTSTMEKKPSSPALSFGDVSYCITESLLRDTGIAFEDPATAAPVQSSFNVPHLEANTLLQEQSSISLNIEPRSESQDSLHDQIQTDIDQFAQTDALIEVASLLEYFSNEDMELKDITDNVQQSSEEDES